MSWRAPGEIDRQIAYLWGTAAVGLLVLYPVWLAVLPALPACPLRAFTGLSCLSCGSTRAALALLHGHPLEAIRWNPLATLATLAVVAGGLGAPLWVRWGRLPTLPRPVPVGWRAAMALSLLANWVYLLTMGE